MKTKTKAVVMAVAIGMVLLAGDAKAASGQGHHPHYQPRVGAQDAMETTTISGGTWIEQGGTDSVHLNGARYIKKLFVQAYASGRDTTVQVIVNGDVKGTIYLPGRDPSYVVTIGEVASSIQFQNIGGGSARIQEVKAVQSVHVATGYGHGYGRVETSPSITTRILSVAAINTSSDIAARAIELVDSLEYYSNLNDYSMYLLPIKKVSGRLYASAMARGDLSAKVAEKLMTLREQIDFAAAYIDNSFERDSTFELATALLGLREEIDALMN